MVGLDRVMVGLDRVMVGPDRVMVGLDRVMVRLDQVMVGLDRVMVGLDRVMVGSWPGHCQGHLLYGYGMVKAQKGPGMAWRWPGDDRGDGQA